MTVNDLSSRGRIYLSFASPGPLGILLLLLLGWTGCSDTPSRTEEFIAAGDRHLQAGNLPQAIASYRRAFLQDTLNPAILSRLGKVYQAQGNPTAASTYLRRAAHIAYQLGVEARRAGDDSTAADRFRQTIEYLPQHPLALNGLGEICLTRGDETQALVYFEQSAQVNPRFAETFLKLGQLYLARGDRDAARKAFQTAVEANINALEGYLQLGEISLQEQKWAEAAQHFDNALLIHPQSIQARAGLANARAHL